MREEPGAESSARMWSKLDISLGHWELWCMTCAQSWSPVLVSHWPRAALRVGVGLDGGVITSWAKGPPFGQGQLRVTVNSQSQLLRVDTESTTTLAAKETARGMGQLGPSGEQQRAGYGWGGGSEWVGSERQGPAPGEPCAMC